MQAVVRPCLNAGIALVAAGAIAAAPIAPPPMNIELPAVQTATVSLTASWGPLDPYLSLLNRTFGNVGTVANQAFTSGVAPILQQLVVNQLTFVHDLNAALNQALSSANPSGLPAVLQKAISELAAGQFQNAAQTLSTGLIGVALPIVPTLLRPLENFVNVVSLLPDIALSVGLAVISPPLALMQSTGAALQSVFNAISTGDIGQFVNAVLSAPAVMLDGLLNGYQPTQTGGLLTPGLGSLSILVRIRDMIANALNPAAPVVAPATEAVTETSTDTPTVTLDVVTGTETADTAAIDTAAVDTATDTATTVEASVETTPEVVEAAPEVVEEVAPVDETDATETTETEAAPKDEESDTNSGATDLSDGNKATPGDSGQDSTGASNDDADAADSTATTTSGGTGSDAGNAGSDAGDAGSDSDSGGTE
jgi:hypothetical protein